jgi:membrane protein YqaA with SNARE-associated domain
MDWIAWGYLGLFLAAFLAATILPIASEALFVLMLFSFNPWLCLLVATAGNTLGGFLNYGIGYLAKPIWLKRVGVSQEQIERWKGKVHRYGPWMALLSWLPFIGDVLSVALGFFRSPWKKTFLFIFIGKASRYALLLLFGFYINKAEPYPTGDGIEYILTTEAWKNHGSPDIRLTDYRSFKTDFLAHQAWKDNYKKQAFDEVEQFLASKTRSEYGGFYRNQAGDVYGYHFVFYSLVNTPMRWVSEWVGFHPIKAFIYTNAMFWFAFLVWAFFLLFKRKKLTFLSLLALFFSGIFYYSSWTHPEVFTFVLLASGFLAWTHSLRWLALVFVGLATLQNQPLFFVFLWMLVPLGWESRTEVKKMVLLGILSTIPFMPSIYFWVLFGKTSLIKEAGFLSANNITLERIYGFFMDWNQGMILGIGLWIFVYIFLLIQRGFWVLKNKTITHWDFIPMVVLMMTLTVCAMSNWNHGMAILNRYATWIAVPLLFHAFYLLATYSTRWQRVIFLFCLLTQGGLIKLHNPHNRFDWSNLSHMPIATWFLNHAPSWYNPDPQIFIARTTQQFDFSERTPPVIYCNNTSTITKMAVHNHRLDALKPFGILPSCRKDSWRLVRSGSESWYYLDEQSLKKVNATKSIRHSLREAEIAKIILKINRDPVWKKDIQTKAKINHVSEAVQQRLDAAFIVDHPSP